MTKKKITKKKEKAKITPKTERVFSTPDVWNPFDIWEEASRFFNNDPWSSPWWGHWGWKVPRAGLLSDSNKKIIPIDIVDKGKEYHIVAEVPGVHKKDLEIHVTPENIRICGNIESEITKEDEGYIRKERTYSTLCRSMIFQDEVDPDKSEATLKDGILQIKIPKKENKYRGRKIDIK